MLFSATRLLKSLWISSIMTGPSGKLRLNPSRSYVASRSGCPAQKPHAATFSTGCTARKKFPISPQRGFLAPHKQFSKPGVRERRASRLSPSHFSSLDVLRTYPLFPITEFIGSNSRKEGSHVILH